MNVMNKMTIHIVFLFVFISTQALAQFKSEEDRLEHANELFENKSFIEAEPHMLHFLSTKNNTEFNFKYGVCALFKYADKTIVSVLPSPVFISDILFS